MTAKEVRNKIMKEKSDWKVPAERRIAKFVKKQNSRVAKKKDGNGSIKNGILGKFFKGDRTSNHSAITIGNKHNDNPLQQPGHDSHNIGNSSTDPTHQQQQVSQQRKGLRQASVSVLKALSPAAKNKQTNQGVPIKKSTTADLFRKSKRAMDGGVPISYQQAEAERKSSNHPIDSPIMNGQSKTVIENVQEIESIKALDKGKHLEKEGQNPVKAKRLDPPTKDIADAYTDDNDGKRMDCECGACIIL